MPVFSFSKVGIVKTLVSRESSPPPFFKFFYFFYFAYSHRSALFHVARARVCHQARELILTNFLTVFSLVYPEEGSIAETLVKILIITASVLQFLNEHL